MMKFKWKDMMQQKIQKIYKAITEIRLIINIFRQINYKIIFKRYNNKLMKQKKVKTDYLNNKSITITFKFKTLQTFKKTSNSKKSNFLIKKRELV